MNRLFSPFSVKDVTFRNRIFVSPMCQYSCREGVPNEWHMVHLGSRAVGGAGLVIVEATAVSPEGRISPFDCGLWSDAQAEAFKPITTFIKAQGCRAGIQIAHAGRKASTDAPWHGGGMVAPGDGGWQPLAPSPLPFSPSSPMPREMTATDLDQVVAQFEAAAGRALQAGFEVLELHMAHGYLLHEFLSPLSNHRGDAYGGTLQNRLRLPLRVAGQVRKLWPARLPLFVRISCTDWVEGGWDLTQSIQFCRELKALGVDLIDCSSAAVVPDAKVPVAPGFQVPLAAAIRKEAAMATGAVGLITSAVQAEQILATGQADVVLLAREMLRDPYWPLHAAKVLGVDIEWPRQYLRAK
ncbi:MAG: NADH:flavin oxidoreductase/NADH oxidase [Desulfobacteraceae bacterium]|nr:NADH:flavin oxidoreductase/NADH oxidase [Desulfobacteraceae bacterium]